MIPQEVNLKALILSVYLLNRETIQKAKTSQPLETINQPATAGRRTDEDDRPASLNSNSQTAHIHRTSQIGVAVPLDESTGRSLNLNSRYSFNAHLYVLLGFGSWQYLSGARSGMRDLASVENLPANTATSANPPQAVNTTDPGRSYSITSNSPRDASKTTVEYGTLPPVPAASKSRQDGREPLNMSITDKRYGKSSSSSTPPSFSRRIKYSRTEEASSNVWQGPYDFNLSIDKIEKVVSQTNATMSIRYLPILVRLEPEMIEALQGSHMYLELRKVVSHQGRLPLGKAAQEAIRAIVPADRHHFLPLFSAILIAQDTLYDLREKAAIDPIGPPNVTEAFPTRRGKTMGISFQDRLAKIDEGLEAMCHEIMKDIWGSCSQKATDSLHTAAFGMVRALRS